MSFIYKVKVCMSTTFIRGHNDENQLDYRHPHDQSQGPQNTGLKQIQAGTIISRR